MIKPVCAGNCLSNCNSTEVFAIDSKGYVYCEKHFFRGRKVTKAERKQLIAGKPIRYDRF
jgi:hypothetical protein